MSVRFLVGCQESLWPLYLGYAANRKRRRGEAVQWHETHASQEVDLLIDGFPGSGNSYLTKVIKKTQRADLKIAHHLHAPNQMIRATKLGVPAILVVRDPIDAACSMRRRFGYPLELALKFNLRFHQALIPHLESIYVAKFADITSDPRGVLSQANSSFGVDLFASDFEEEKLQGLWAIGEGLKKMDAERIEKAKKEKAELKKRAERLCSAQFKEELFDCYQRVTASI